MPLKFEYLQCWFMLHRLEDLGLGDSDLAEGLREEMDRLQRMLDAEAIRQVDAVSSALNAERDVVTAERTGRVKELDETLRWLADEYWKGKAC